MVTARKRGMGKFRFIDRGFKKNIVLIPGWASDYRIFSTLVLNYNYLLPIESGLNGFDRELLDELNKRRINKISLLGWSLGGFLSAGFAAGNPQAIDELILVSIREKFSPAALKDAKLKLKKNKKAWLYKFYNGWFSKNEKEQLNWFKKHLLKDYLEQAGHKDLLCGLDYLSQVGINTKVLSRAKNIKIIHGSLDKIAPLEEAAAIKSNLPKAEFTVIKGAGHIPFLNPRFRIALNR